MKFLDILDKETKMSFRSQYAHLIWDRLYDVLIPDQLTLSREYISKFGVHTTGDKKSDQLLSSNFTQVKISVARILEYYDDGIEIQIPSRDDMIKIYKDIELYIAEWREHIKYDINLAVSKNKDFLLSLDKLSKDLYNKAKPNEIIDNLFINKKIGLLVNPLQRVQEERKPVEKADYEGISQLIRGKTSKPQGRF